MTSISLVERKRIQWEREREELRRLGAPWVFPSTQILKTSKSSNYLFENDNEDKNEFIRSNPIRSESNYNLPSIETEGISRFYMGESKDSKSDLERQKRNHYDLSKNSKNYHLFDDESYTSGYQSESNLFFSPLRFRNETDNKEIKSILKNNVFENQNHKSNNIDSNKSQYSKNSSSSFYNHQNESSRNDYISHSATLSNNTWAFKNSYIDIPPPAMRSSFTTFIDAADHDAYKEMKKEEHKKWLNELERQIKEKKLRKEAKKIENVHILYQDRNLPNIHQSQFDRQYQEKNHDYHNEPEVNSGSNSRNNNKSKLSEDYVNQYNFTTHSQPPAYKNSEECRRIRRAEGSFSTHSEKISSVNEVDKYYSNHLASIRKQIAKNQTTIDLEEQTRRIDENERNDYLKINSNQRHQIKSADFVQQEKIDYFLNRNGHNISLVKPENFVEQFENENENFYLYRKNLNSSLPILPIENPQSSQSQSAKFLNSSKITPESMKIPYIDENYYYEAQMDENKALITSESQNSNKINTLDSGTQTENDNKIKINIDRQKEIENFIDNGDKSDGHQSIGNDITIEKTRRQRKQKPKWDMKQPEKSYLKQSDKNHQSHELLEIQKRTERLVRRETRKLALQNSGVYESKKVESLNKNPKNLAYIPDEINNDKDAQKPKNFMNFDNNIASGKYKRKKSSKRCPPPEYESDFEDELQNLCSTSPCFNVNKSFDIKANLSISSPVVIKSVSPKNEPYIHLKYRTDSPPIPAVMKKLMTNSQDEIKTEDDNLVKDFITESNSKPNQKTFDENIFMTNRKENRKENSRISTNTKSISNIYDEEGKLVYHFSHKDGSKSSTSTSDEDEINIYYSPPLKIKNFVNGLQNLSLNCFPSLEDIDSRLEFYSDSELEIESFSQTMGLDGENVNKSTKDDSEIILKSETATIGSSIYDGDEEEYVEPYLEKNRKKSTLKWLRESLSSNYSKDILEKKSKNSVVNLSQLKKGLKVQQEEFGTA